MSETFSHGKIEHITTILLPMELYEKLKFISENRKIPISTYMIKATRYYIKNHPNDLAPPLPDKE